MKTFKWDEKPNQHSFAYKVTSYPPGIIAYSTFGDDKYALC